MKAFESLLLLVLFSPLLVASAPSTGVRGETEVDLEHVDFDEERDLKGKKSGYYEGEAHGSYYHEPEQYHPQPKQYYPEPEPYEPEPYHPHHEPEPYHHPPHQYAPQPWQPYYSSDGKKSGKKSGKKGHHYSAQTHHPYPPHPPPHHKYPPHHNKPPHKKHPPKYPPHKKHPPKHHPHNDCIWYRLPLAGFVNRSIAVFPGIDQKDDLGASFMYNGAVFEDSNLTVPLGGDMPNSFITGTCQRFQAQMMDANGNTIVGAGTCSFTYTSTLEGLEGTIEMSGELFDITPSKLSIVGGTDIFTGCAGQVNLVPGYAPDTGTDVFTDAIYMEAMGEAQVKVCSEHHLVNLPELEPEPMHKQSYYHDPNGYNSGY